MEIKVIALEPDYTHLALVGRLDVIGAGEVENKFIGFTVARKQNALVDLDGITFLGSMGLRIFISTAKALGLAGKKLVLVNAKPLVKDVLEASGITTFIPVEDSTEAGILQAKS